MRNNLIIVVILVSIGMTLVSGCATKPYMLTNDFGTNDESTVTVPKYQSSLIVNSAYLDLHPSDIVLNVELNFDRFGSQRMVDFQYDPKIAMLRYQFTMHTRYTLTPKFGHITCKINYLAYNQLYTYNRVREVYEFHSMEKAIRYLPEFKGKLKRDVPIKYGPDQLLESNAYQRLYTELASLDSTQKRALKKTLDEKFIEKVPSEDVKRYFLTIQSILNMQDR